VDWSLNDLTTNAFIPEGDISELAGNAKATGSGTGFSAMVGSSFQLNPTFSVALDLGYRSAKVDNLEITDAVGQDKRFPGGEEEDTIVRRPGDWSVIDVFLRRPDGSWEGRYRPDPQENGGCEGCPLYYQGGELDVDYSGLFSVVSLRAHFF
jgi:hypothetical protein